MNTETCYPKSFYKITSNHFITNSVKSSPPMILEDKEENKKRINTLKSHINSDDYFCTLAAVLDLSRQIAERKISELEKAISQNSKLLKRLQDDLIFLQENYKIVKKK